MKTKVIIVSVLVFLVICGGVLYYFLKGKKNQPQAQSLPPTISLSPTEGTLSVNDTVSIDINVDTAGRTTSRADVVLSFNPQVLQVQDADAEIGGVQIINGSIFANYTSNSVDNSSGQIILTGEELTNGFNGAGRMATISFKAIGAGVADIVFNFSPRSLTPTDLIETGTGLGILELVINSSYAVQAVVVPPIEPPITPPVTPPVTPPSGNTNDNSNNNEVDIYNDFSGDLTTTVTSVDSKNTAPNTTPPPTTTVKTKRFAVLPANIIPEKVGSKTGITIETNLWQGWVLWLVYLVIPAIIATIIIIIYFRKRRAIQNNHVPQQINQGQ